MRLSIPPNTTPPTLTDVHDAIGRLRVELEQTDDATRKAGLLLELGVLGELGRDDHSAAKDLLGAINLGNNLREPLERLVFLIERRRSFKNLGKLLDRLGRVANNTEEIVRAQLARGDFLTDHQGDHSAARVAYEAVTSADDALPAPWLALQFLAATTDDHELAIRCLDARAHQAADPEHQSLLMLNLAIAQGRAGKEGDAQRTLGGMVQSLEPYRFAGLSELERLARGREDGALAVTCLERMAELVSQAMSDAAVARRFALPAFVLTPAAAADLWHRAGLGQRALSDLSKANQFFLRAQQLLPSSMALAYAYMLSLESTGDLGAAVELAQRMLENPDLTGSTRATLALRVANGELARGDLDGALRALQVTLKADPASVPARALQLNLLQQTERAEELASAVESMADLLTRRPSKIRQFLLAAYLWSHGCNNTDAAKAALSQATAAGCSPLTSARVSRMLAALSQDSNWEREAITRVLKSGKAEEALSARLQQARSAWLARDERGARAELDSLAEDASASWLACVLLAYGGLGEEDGAAALLTLSKQQQDAQAGAALRQLVAFRRQRSEQPNPAIKLLKELQAENPADPVVAQQLAFCQLQLGQSKAAADSLSTAADSNEHLDVAQAFLVQAAISCWRSNERETAVKFLERAQESNPDASAGLLSWALRSARPDMPDARRRALAAAEASAHESDLLVLERFALEVGLQQHKADATAALDGADAVGLGDVGDAVQLARALWTPAAGHEDALKSLDSRSAAGLRIARAVAFGRVRAELNPDPDELADLAAPWAATGSLPAALEWLAAAQAAERVEDEVKARELVAQHLTGEAKAAVLAGGALVDALEGGKLPAPLHGAHAQVRLTNAELAPPGADPRRRVTALMELGDLAGEEVFAQNLVLVGYNQLLLGDHEGALESFHAAAKTHPEDIAIYEGMRDAATQAGDLAAQAEACFRLGQLGSEPQQAAEHYRTAAYLYLDQLDQRDRGFRALSEAVKLDIDDFDSFNRLFRRLRDEKQHDMVLDLTARRLEVAKDAKEITKLYWERARAQRALKNTDAALVELENVRLLEPAHVGAMALMGEICLTTGKLEQAAEHLASLAAHPEAPNEQRLMSGMAAVDLYETKLGNLTRALELLAVLTQAKLSTMPVRERLARAAAKAERWEDAARLLEELMVQRETQEGRVEAARLAMAIYRDRLEEPERALAACRALLREEPTDAEAIDLVLEEVFDDEDEVELLENARVALIAACQQGVEAEQVARLARIAELSDDLALRQASLGVLVSLGVNTHEMRAELLALDQRSHHHPRMAVSEEMAARILHPDYAGPIASMMSLLSPVLSEVIGPTLKSLGVGRKHRIKAQSGSELRSELAHWAGALGLGEFELYVGGPDPHGMVCVPDGKLAEFVVGDAVRPPFNALVRQRIAKTVFAAARGCNVVLTRESVDVAALIVAACRVCDVQLTSPEYALTGEFQRLLSKELPRRTKKELAPLAEAVAKAAQDPLAWAEVASASLDRLAAVAVGDASWVVLQAAERETTQRNVDAQTEQQRAALFGFCLSPEFKQLREQLGLAVK